MSLAPGSRLGPYQILEYIGAGGMGEVYRSRDPRLEREVAIKVLSEQLAADSRALARFEREAKAVAALSHPNILAIYDIGADSGVNFIVMELLEGETLRSRLTRGPLTWQKAVEIAAGVAEGVDAAHGKGVVHRDLKPENVFLTSAGRVKILDFGVASFRPSPSTGKTVVTQTETGTIMGTAAYMAPEQVRGESPTAPCDIFSLGCVLYEMLTGRRAFGRPTAAESMAAILTEEPEFSGTSARVPIELQRVVHHCLEKTCRLRFHSVHDLIFALDNLDHPQEAAPSSLDSIAVLPFASSSGPDTEYLSDGITESLINNFSCWQQLRVVPRSVAFRYKGRNVDPQETGRDLNVRVLLTGKVLLRGDRLSVQAELVDTSEQKQIWGERFNRTVSDILEVEDEIARHIAYQLRARLSGKSQNRSVRRFTENTTAYQLYLKGRYDWAKRTPDSITRAINYFEQATCEDPVYALAYAGLSEGCILQGWYGLSTAAEALERSGRAARRAVEIEPELAEGHAALGFAKACARDWAGAEEAFQRALQCNPGYWLAYDWYAISLCGMGHYEQAIAAIRKAQQLDPLSLVIQQHSAWVYLHARHYDNAIEQCRKALDLDPGYSLAHLWAGLAYSQKSMHDEALTSLRAARESLGNIPYSIAALAHASAGAGLRSEAADLLQELIAADSRYHVDPYHCAIVHAALDGRDRVFECLEMAYRERSVWLACWLKSDPRLDSVRADPRFSDLLKRIGVNS